MMPRAAGGGAVWPLLGLMVLSGIAGLGYQVAWVRMLALGLGHEIFAVLAVVAAFFAGLAVGAWALDRRIARSSRPGIWYVGAELIIGFWAVALIWLMPLANGAMADAMGAEPSEAWRWAVAFGGTFLLLAPATVAMGATLPAAERVLAGLARTGRGFGGVYAANTFGAVLGVVGSAFWLLPALGYSTSLWIFAAINLACAAAMWAVSRHVSVDASLAPEARMEPVRLVPALLFLTGLMGIGVEVAGVRALSQLLENTVYSFASALAVYLLATSLGAALYHRWRRSRTPGTVETGAVLLLLTGLATALGGLAVFAVEDLHAAVRGALPVGTTGAMVAEVVAAAVVFALPATLMGALFTHLALAMRRADGGIGAALGVNTLGAALAPLGIGALAIPALGIVPVLALLATGYALLGLYLHRDRTSVLLAVPTVAAIALLLAGPFNRTLVTPPPGGAVIAHVEGAAATASVVKTAGGARFLRVNGRFTMGGTTSYRLDRLQAHAALMQMAAPRRALFLGVGTGATVAAAVDHPELDVTAVDLSPEVLALIPEFPEVAADLARGSETVRLRVADARRAVRTAEGAYDLILADTYHPSRDGAGLLYTREHFAAIREKLTPDGTFVQWLPLHQLDLPTLRIIVRTYLAVFPDARLFMGNYNLATPLLALYARRDGRVPAMDDIAGREIPLPLRAALNEVGLKTPFDLFGGFIAGPQALRGWAKTAPINRDDLPVVLFRAPRTVYAPLGPPIDRLLTLVGALDGTPDEALDLTGVPRAAELSARLAAYWQARDQFLQLGTRAAVTGELSRDVATLAPQLIDILRVSPDFAPAYDPVLSMARAVLQRDRNVARTLLMALHRAAPQRPEAKALLARLDG